MTLRQITWRALGLVGGIIGGMVLFLPAIPRTASWGNGVGFGLMIMGLFGLGYLGGLLEGIRRGKES